MTGYTFAYYKLDLSTLKELWQQVFKGKPSALCFNGRISGYELGVQASEPIEGFATSISGTAFNDRLELRWKQVAAGTFKALLLTELDLTQPDHDIGLKLPKSTEFTVVSGRHDDPAKLSTKKGHIILQASYPKAESEQNDKKTEDVGFIEAERRLPNPAARNDLRQVNYFYYQDKATQQVRFIRHSAT
jgi:hypothetical protein